MYRQGQRTQLPLDQEAWAMHLMWYIVKYCEILWYTFFLYIIQQESVATTCSVIIMFLFWLHPARSFGSRSNWRGPLHCILGPRRPWCSRKMPLLTFKQVPNRKLWRLLNLLIWGRWMSTGKVLCLLRLADLSTRVLLNFFAKYFRNVAWQWMLWTTTTRHHSLQLRVKAMKFAPIGWLHRGAQ